MRYFFRLIPIALLCALAIHLTAEVTVKSPVNGSSMSNPVEYMATATTTKCSKGVASIGVYVDDVLISRSVTSGDELNMSLVIAPGAHQTVVEEWDKCGGASYTKLDISVTGSFATSPAFSMPEGAYTAPQWLSLSDATRGAVLYYTTDGTIPTASSKPYSHPFPVASTETINAVAIAPGYENSPVASATYTFTLPTAPPRFSLPAGAYTSEQSVILSDATPGAIIYFTMDRSAPTTSSYLYAGPLQVANTETINAIAVAPGYTASSTASAEYRLKLPAEVPAFSVPAGSYKAAQSVTLSSATQGAEIRFTLDGTSPSHSSALYSGPISVGASETIMAIAAASGYSNSAVASAVYTIKHSATGPNIPAYAIRATMLQVDPSWKFNHDPGTSGSSVGTLALVSDPSLSGSAAQFNNRFTNWGGEIYHLSFANDTASSNFVYDTQVWIEQGSKIGNLELDMNQVLSDGNTVIFGFQCDGDHGTWDYSANVGAISVSKISWKHSTSPCNPAKWTSNAWHHIQIGYSRDDLGNVTYNSVWLDGVETEIGVTVPSAQALGWEPGDLLINFQVDGFGESGASVVYADDLTISRW